MSLSKERSTTAAATDLTENHNGASFKFNFSIQMHPIALIGVLVGLLGLGLLFFL